MFNVFFSSISSKVGYLVFDSNSLFRPIFYLITMVIKSFDSRVTFRFFSYVLIKKFPGRLELIFPHGIPSNYILCSFSRCLKTSPTIFQSLAPILPMSVRLSSTVVPTNSEHFFACSSL